MDALLVNAPLVVVAVAVLVLSPFGRDTLRSVGHGGLTLAHARSLVRVMTVVALLVALAAFLNLR